MHPILFKNFKIARKEKLVLMCGPCVIESEEHSMKTAEAIKKICDKHNVELIFKSSYDKANRSSYEGFRGPGIEKGLAILKRVKEEFGLPLVTDVHSKEEAKEAAKVVDILQIPAFLCRQTDLIVAAADTGAIVSVKKGQFLAPWDMENIVHKVESRGNQKIILVERGTTFGYNNLVADMRSIPIMQQYGYPVCFDGTHSVQKPGGLGKSSGGDREFIPVLTKSALAAGADCLFLEAHENPKEAKSDAASVLSLDALDFYLPQFNAIYKLTQEQRHAL